MSEYPWFICSYTCNKYTEVKRTSQWLKENAQEFHTSLTVTSSITDGLGVCILTIAGSQVRVVQGNHS